MVDIPISASGGDVVQALRDIRTAIAQAKGEALDFAAIDLSHGELQGLGAEVKQVLKNFEDLVRVGRGATAAGVRAAAGLTTGTQFNSDAEVIQSIGKWSQNIGSRYPDKSDRERHVRNTLNYLAQGTSLPGGDDDSPDDDSPQDPSPKPSPLPKRRSEGLLARAGRTMGGSLGSMLGGDAGMAMGGNMGAMAMGMVPELALPLLALAGLQGAGKMVGQAVTNAAGEDQSDDQFLRTIQGSVADFSALRDAARDAARGLQLTYEQSATLGATFAQIANISDPNSALNGMRGAVGFGRATGIDPNAAVSSFASATLLGMDPERFATLIEGAAVKGNMTSQTPQVMQAILNFATNASRFLVTGGAIAGATENYASMYAMLNASGNPGLHGANADAILGSINSAVMNGGNAGIPGQVMTYQALARAGITDPYLQASLTSAGAFAPILSNEKGVDNVYDALRLNVFSQSLPGIKLLFYRAF